MIKFFDFYKVLNWLSIHNVLTNNKVQSLVDNHNNKSKNNIDDVDGDFISSTSSATAITTTTKNITVQPQPNKINANSSPSDIENDDEIIHLSQLWIRKLIKHHSDSQNKSLRLEKVVSGKQSIKGNKNEKIKDDIIIKCKSLMKFSGVFILYSCFGCVMFFYIEECSGQ